MSKHASMCHVCYFGSSAKALSLTDNKNPPSHDRGAERQGAVSNWRQEPQKSDTCMVSEGMEPNNDRARSQIIRTYCP